MLLLHVSPLLANNWQVVFHKKAMEILHCFSMAREAVGMSDQSFQFTETHFKRNIVKDILSTAIKSFQTSLPKRRL